MYLITTILLIVIIIIISIKSGFIEGWVDPKGEIIVPPVDYGFAMKEIGSNLEREKRLIAALVPYYERLIDIAANNKVDKNKYKTKMEIKEAADREKSNIRINVDKEESGRILPLFDVNNALNAISKTERVPDEVKYFVSYLYLPKTVEIYKNTAEFLNTKCINVYKFLANLGGQEGAGKIQKSSAESLGATISGFQDINISSASILAKGNLQDNLSQFAVTNKEKKINIGPDQIQLLYRISTTRITELESLNLGTTILKEMVNNFNKLNQLLEQIEKGGNENTFASIMVDGKTPEEAISAFEDIGTIPFAYLIR